MARATWLVLWALFLPFGSAQGAAQIAIIDTGVSITNELAGKISSGGFNFVDNNSDTTDLDGHGTIVATIALQTAGSAEILPIRVLSTFGGTAVDINGGIRHAAARSQVRVLNLSLGGPYTDPGIARALLDSARAGQIVVIAAGNGVTGDSGNTQGLPNPVFPAQHAATLGGLGIIAGALNATGSIADYSNRAGDFKDVYMVANGVFGGFDPINFPTDPTIGTEGTSFAAPRISGAALAILNAAPHLTGNQVVEILFSTATDLGAAGVDSVYGQGALNLTAALAPVGGIAAPTASKTNGGSVPVVASALLVGAAAYAFLQRNPKAKSALVLDQYERPYVIDLGKMTQARDDKPGLQALMSSFRYENAWMDVPVGSRHTLSIRAASIKDIQTFNASDYFANRRENEERRPDVAMSISGKPSKNLQYRFDLNQDPRKGYGALGIQSKTYTQFLSERTFTAPYMGFADRGNSMHVGYKLGSRSHLKLGLASINDGLVNGLKSSAMMMEGSYQLSDAATLSLQLGQLSEQGSLFGGSSGGVFGVDSTNTSAVGINGRYQITDNMAVIGSYTRGYTKVVDAKNSLLHNFSSVQSQAYGMGLVANDVWRGGDRFGLAVSRPLRIIGGKVDFTVPQARDIAGNVYSETDRVSLRPEGNELDLEASYNWTVGKKTHLATYFLYQNEPLNLKDNGRSRTLYGVIRRAF
ncbi:MAG: S8 family serine peptidase [Gammaproteobacteria bacterium]|nr:S8 family serine peptidase [Gammaproteobacteria bacterium]